MQPDSFTSPVWVLIQNYLGLSMLFSVLAASSIFGFWFAYYPNRFTLALHLSLATFVLVFIAGSIFKQYVLGAVSIVPVVFFTLPILSNAVLVGGVYKYHEHVFARSLHGNAVLFRDTR